MYFVLCIIMALIPLLGIEQEGKIEVRNIKIFPTIPKPMNLTMHNTKSNPNYKEG